MSERRINLIGGSAYSTAGCIQAVNRLLVRELAASKLLQKAFFLWDYNETASAPGLKKGPNSLSRAKSGFEDVVSERHIGD